MPAAERRNLDADPMTADAPYAEALAALVRAPGRESMTDLVKAALREERAADAAQLLPALRGAVPADFYHQAMVALLLETPDHRLAQYHLDALGPAGAPADLEAGLRVSVDVRRGDLATAISRLEALEAAGARPLSHFSRKWAHQQSLGRFDGVEREIAILRSRVPPDQVTSHALLRLQEAGLIHNRRRFAEAAGLLDRLLEDCLEQGLAALPETPQRPHRTAARLHRMLADLEGLVILYALPVALTGAGLLGLVRDGRVLPHDKDLDLAVLEPATTAQVAERLVASGLFRENRTPFTFGPYRSLRHRATDMVLDLLAHEAEAGVRFNRWRDEDGTLLREAVLPFYRPRPVDHAGTGLRLPMPDDPEAHLAALYGDWRVPEEGFVSVIAARNLTGHTPFLASLGRSKVVDHLLHGRRRRGVAALRQLLAREPDSPTLRRALEALG